MPESRWAVVKSTATGCWLVEEWCPDDSVPTARGGYFRTKKEAQEYMRLQKTAPTFVVVYINDDLSPSVYGPFRKRETAQRWADKMTRTHLDPDRDPAGGGVGCVHVQRVRSRAEWQ